MDGSMHIAVISSNQSVESWDLLAHCACKSRNYMRSALVDPGLTCGQRQGVQEIQADQSEARKSVTTNHKSWTALAHYASRSGTYM